MPRSQNAHAIINAGLLFKFKNNDNTLEKATIVYGNVNPEFVHASRTEEFLIDKDPFAEDVLELALQSLHAEINPDTVPPEPSAEYRKMLAVSLYYKVLIF